MNMTLKQIKRFIIQEKYVFILKAEDVLIYTKGKIYEEGGRERFYILISSKKAL